MFDNQSDFDARTLSIGQFSRNTGQTKLLNRYIYSRSSTFHRFCARLLRQYARHLGLEENYSIYDTGDSRYITLEELAAKEMPDVRFVKVDVDAEPALAQRFGITSIPTLKLFHAGELVGSQVGALGKPQLRETIDRTFNLRATA